MLPRLALSCAMLLPLPLLAQQQEPDTASRYRLQEIIVSATRSPQNITDVARSVSVVSADEISYSPLNAPASVLSTLPGVYVVGGGQNPGAVQNIALRGANTNNTEIMVDGMRLDDPSTVDEAFDLSELTLANVSRVEVVRGAHSSLYGSSAIGGVINFITDGDRQQGLHVSTDWHAGVFGPKTSLASEKVFVDYGAGAWFIRTGLLNSFVHGLDATVDTVTNPATFQQRDRDNSRSIDWIGTVAYRDGPFDFSATLRHGARHFDLDKSAFVDDNNYTGQSQRNLFQARLGYAMNPGLRATYRVEVTNSYRQYVNDSSVIDLAGNTDRTFTRDTYRSGFVSNEVQVNVEARYLSLVTGAGISRETMNSQNYLYSAAFGSPFILFTDLGPQDIHATLSDLFVHAELSGGIVSEDWSPFSATAGFRVNWHNQYGSNVTVEAGPAYHPSPQTMIYGTFSTGFNAPSLYQLYDPTPDPGSGITRGNRRLHPETSRTFEIGVRHTVLPGFTAGVALYRTILDHEIEYAYLWNPAVPIDALGFADYRGDTYLNVGTQTNDGLEVTLTGEVSDDLSFTANASMIRGKLSYSPEALDRVKTDGNVVQLYNSGAFLTSDYQVNGLVRRPTTLNARCSYRPIVPLVLQATVRYVGSRNDVFYDLTKGPNGALGTFGIASYALTDLSLRYSFSTSIAATLFIENLFDRKYSEIAGYTTRGRGLYGQLQVGW